MIILKQAALLLTLVGFFVYGQMAFAADEQNGAASDVPNFIRIPVFYLTDRCRLDDGKSKAVDFGIERQYFGVCKHDPFLGVAYCTIKNAEHKPLSASCENLGWQASKHDGEGPDGITVFSGAKYEDVKNNFYEELYRKSTPTKDHELFMFAPGYMSTFESGLRSAARLAYYAERPVLFYSWASKGKFTGYFADEATIEWTQDHFNDAIARLTELGQRTPALRVRLFAHSMGGRLVLRATPLLKSNSTFKEVSVVCPDVDDGVVKHYAAKYFDGKGNQLVRLYVSKRDVMLRISQLVHGGYSRFGEDREPLDNLIPKNERTVVEVAEPGSTIAAPASASNACFGSLSRKLLTIDFTAVDIGTLGHRIPVELLCSLSQRGEPGQGLSLCIARQKVVRGKIRDSISTSSSEDESDPDDGIIKVLSDKRWHGTPLIGLAVKYRPRIQLLLTKDWSLK